MTPVLQPPPLYGKSSTAARIKHGADTVLARSVLSGFRVPNKKRALFTRGPEFQIREMHQFVHNSINKHFFLCTSFSFLFHPHNLYYHYRQFLLILPLLLCCPPCTRDTLACCWDVKQASNQQTDLYSGYTGMLLGRQATNQPTNRPVLGIHWHVAGTSSNQPTNKPVLGIHWHVAGTSSNQPTNKPVLGIHWHVAGTSSNQPTNQQTCTRDTLACCWDVKQPTNQPTNLYSGGRKGGSSSAEMFAWVAILCRP